MKYYKRYWLPDSPVYYRVYPDGHYEWCDRFCCKWYRDLPTDNWIQYLNLCICKGYPEPFEVSELEVLVIFGPKAVI